MAFSEAGGAAQGVANEALRTTLFFGGDIALNISSDRAVVRDVLIAGVTLGAIYAGYKLIAKKMDGAVKKGLGGERDDQEVRDIQPKCLHVLLHCFTDERFLEVLDDYESGRMKKCLEKEFLLIGIEVEGLKVEIENIEVVKETKTAINQRKPMAMVGLLEKVHIGEGPRIMVENLDPAVAHFEKPKKPYKVVFTGEYDVGKTSLFRRMFKKDFCEKKPPSSEEKGTHHEIFPEDETVIPLEIWDTADMDRDRSITQSYYRNSHFVLLVYSAVDELSLYRLDAMATNIKYYEPRAKLIVVRNKTDLPLGDDGVTPEREQAFIRNMKTKITENFWTSAKENNGVEILLRELAKYSLEMFKSRRKLKVPGGEFSMDLVHERSEQHRVRAGSCNLY